MNEDWTKDIQRLMADRKVKAPDGLLEEVKQRLASTSPVALGEPIQPARKVAMWRYRWLTAAAVVAAIAVPVTWRLLKVDESPRVVAVTRAVQQSANRAEAATALGTGAGKIGSAFATVATKAGAALDAKPVAGVLATNHEAASANPVNAETIAMASETFSGQNAPMTSNEEKGRPSEEKSKLLEEKSKPLSESRRQTKPVKHSGRNDYQYQAEAGYARRGSAPASSRLSLTAYCGGALNGNGLGDGGNVNNANAYYSDAMPFGAFPMQLGKANVYMAKQHEVKAHHAQPVKVGVSLGYRLSSRWAVNTGVTYSYLSSNFAEDKHVVERQKLHYVGVPLTASYSFLLTRHAEVYVTAGGEVEKLVKGSREMDNFEPDNLTEKRPQWSVKAAVGGAYHFTPSLSVYAEPGMTHFFDNHSSVVNVYKDRPTSFSLNIGLRFNIK